MTSAGQTPLEEKQRSIIEAATTLFRRYGYRRTSVDLIAKEAQAAKGTVYAYFEGKEAIFRAVCEYVCAKILASAEAARDAAAGVEGRVFGILDAKFTFLYELVHSSPHAAEILDSQNSLGADIIAKTDRAFRRLLTAELSAAAEEGALDLARASLSSASAAEILIRCAYGAASDAQSA